MSFIKGFGDLGAFSEVCVAPARCPHHKTSSFVQRGLFPLPCTFPRPIPSGGFSSARARLSLALLCRSQGLGSALAQGCWASGFGFKRIQSEVLNSFRSWSWCKFGIKKTKPLLGKTLGASLHVVGLGSDLWGAVQLLRFCKVQGKLNVSERRSEIAVLMKKKKACIRELIFNQLLLG